MTRTIDLKTIYSSPGSRLPARTLVYAMVVLLVNALLISALLLLYQQTDALTQQQQHDNRLLRNLDSAIAYILSHDSLETPRHVDLFGDGVDRATVGKADWGLYKLGFAEVTGTPSFARDSLARAILIGLHAAPSLDRALYVAGVNNPVFFADHVVICGDLQLPLGVYRHANIGNQLLARPDEVHGAVTASTAELPAFDEPRLRRTVDGLAAVRCLPERPPEYAVHSFFDPAAGYEADSLALENQELAGHLVIRARRKIVVRSSCTLQDVVLYAPEVTIEPGFRGTVQVFASERIEVGERVRLHYPSALVLHPRATGAADYRLHLASGAEVEGCVVAWPLVYSAAVPEVFVERDATVRGQIFSAGFVNLQGRVEGNVTSASLLYRTGGMLLGNHLVGATIDRCRLDSLYLHGFTDRDGGDERIIKWVH
jgi:hypothetical protein